MKVGTLAFAWMMAVVVMLRPGFAQQPPPLPPESWQEEYAVAMLEKLGGAHLHRDVRNHRVKSVALVNVGPIDTALGFAASLPALTELEVVALPWQQFSDAGLSRLRGMSRLEQLQLVGPRISDHGVGYLAGLKNLHELSIDAPITDASLPALGGLKQLRLLDLYGTRVTGVGLSQLTGLDQLEFLNLDRTQMGDAGAPALAQLTALRTLLLRGTRITDDGLVQLALLPNLERLYLDGTRVTEMGLGRLAGDVDPQLMTFTGAVQLRELSLRGAPNLRGDNLQGLANIYGLPYFRKLDITNTPLTRDPTKVRQLARAEQTAEHWRGVQGIGSVGPIVRFDENLNLMGLYFTPPAFSASNNVLNELYDYPPETLQELSLRDALLRNTDLARLSRLTNLRRLNLYRTRISNEGLQHLQSLPNLRELILAEGDALITAEGEDALRTALPELQITRVP